MNLINPHFKVDGNDCYTLCFDGFEGIGNIDEDGDEFFYCVECEPLTNGWYSWNKIKYHYYWTFDIIYEDDAFEADLSDDEMEFVMQYMLEKINEYKGE